jgi:deaminated glutathione amidase
MVMGKARIATCQFPVSQEISRNAQCMKRMMRKAAAGEASIVHFPEAALSGYCRVNGETSNNWLSLEAATAEIVDLASELGVWVVFGSSRLLDGHPKPTNCSLVVSNNGLLFTYDKRKLTPGETEWYRPGEGSGLVIDIHGIKCGFLICYEAQFPGLWESYERRGVRFIFHSSHNVSRNPQPLLQELTLAQVRTRAADHGLWISHSNSSARHSFSTAFVARPDGSVTKFRKHKTGILFTNIPD